MKMHIFKILFALFLTGFSSGSALADVTFDGFESKPAAKAQSRSGAKSSAKPRKPKGHQVKKQPHPGQQNKKPSKADAAVDTVSGESPHLVSCREKLQMHYKKNLQQAVSWSRQFATEQVDNAKLATLKALREGEKWAGQCKGEF